MGKFEVVEGLDVPGDLPPRLLERIKALMAQQFILEWPLETDSQHVVVTVADSSSVLFCADWTGRLHA